MPFGLLAGSLARRLNLKPSATGPRRRSRRLFFESVETREERFDNAKSALALFLFVITIPIWGPIAVAIWVWPLTLIVIAACIMGWLDENHLLGLVTEYFFIGVVTLLLGSIVLYGLWQLIQALRTPREQTNG